MDRGPTGISDAALEAMPHAQLIDAVKDIGMAGDRRGESRESTLRRIPARRDQPVNAPGPSERPDMPRPRQMSADLETHLLAVVICFLLVAVYWYLARTWAWNYMDDMGFEWVSSMGSWIDWTALFGWIGLLFFWLFLARKYTFLAFVWGLPHWNVSTNHEGPDDDPPPAPSDEEAEHNVSAALDDMHTEHDYDEIRQSYQRDKHAGKVYSIPEFPTSAQEYREMRKAHILRRLASALLCYSSAQRDLEAVRTTPNSSVVIQDTNAEVESLRSKCDRLQACLIRATEEAEAAKSTAQQLNETIGKVQGDICGVKDENSRYTQELIRLRGKVWVFARLRPKTEGDPEDQFIDLTLPDQYNYALVLRGGQIDEKHPIDAEYEFDRVFHHTDTNQTVYQHIKPMVQAAMDGLDLAIILDGPSGSGKSYTMFEPSHGLAFSIARYIFKRPRLEKDPPGQMQIKISNFRVYKEMLLDATNRKGDPKDNMFYIRDLPNTELEVHRDHRFRSKVDGKVVSTAQQLTSEFMWTLHAREQRKTAQNATSSRGHAICKLEFSSSGAEARGPKKSCLFLVDLAGPEPFSSSPDPEETKNITKGRVELRNRLGDVIKLHQSRPKSEVRKKETESLRLNVINSKLTHILRDCFLGEPRIVIIATANPYAAKEHRPRIRETFDFATKMSAQLQPAIRGSRSAQIREG